MIKTPHKDYFHFLLDEHLSATEKDDIKNMCNVEVEKQSTTEQKEQLYKEYIERFVIGNYNYENFKLNVASSQLRREYCSRTWELEDNKLAEALDLQNEFHDKILRWVNHSNPQLCNEVGNLHKRIELKLWKLYACKQSIPKLLEMLNDELSINKVKEEEYDINKITFFCGNGNHSIKSEHFTSSFKYAVMEYFRFTRLRTNITCKELKKEIDEYKFLNKRLLGHFIRSIYQILIDYSSIEWKESTTDVYGLKDRKNRYIALEDRISCQIYDLCVYCEMIEPEGMDDITVLLENRKEVKKDTIRTKLSSVACDENTDYDKLFEQIYNRYL